NFSPDGKILVSSKSTSVWDTVAGTPRPKTQSQAFAAPLFDLLSSRDVFSADGKLTASVGLNGVVVKDSATGKTVQTINPGRSTGMMGQLQISGIALGTRGLVINYCEFKMSGKSGILGGGGGSQECHIKTFDPRSGQELKDLKLESEKGSFMG